MIKKIIKYGIISVFILLVAVQADKKFVLDEIDFPIVAKATSQILKPVYYRGEQSPQHIGIYHPTLYVNSLAVFVKVFGFNEISVRFFGLICTLMSAFLLVLIYRMFRGRNELTELFFLGLFLLNPYTIANTTLPDIDSTVLPVCFLLFVYLSLKYIWKEKKSDFFIISSLGCLFALNLWSKLTTPLVLPFFVLALMIIVTGNIKRSIINTTAFTLLGIGIFLISYFVYCQIFDLPFSYTFTFLVQSFFKGTANQLSLVHKLSNNFSNIKSLVYWITIPLTYIYFLSLVSVLLIKKKDQETRIIKLLSIFGLFVLVFYLALISPFGGFFKYPFPVFGFMILAVVFFYQENFVQTKVNIVIAFLAAALAILYENHFLRDNMFISQMVFNHLPLLWIGVLIGYILLNLKKSSSLAKIALPYFIIAIIGFQVNISRVQAKAPYPTKYHYGQQGFDETVNYLKAKTRKDEVIWSMKDIGYYVNNRYIENYGFFFDKSLNAELERLTKEGKVRYYVATTGIGEDRVDYYLEIMKILEKNTELDANFGNFVIYKAK